MRYVMKQKLWSFGTKFIIKDENDNDQFLVNGKVFAIGDQLSFTDLAGNELAFIRQKLFAWGKTYEIYHNQQLFAVVKENWLPLPSYRFTVDVGADGAGPGDMEIQGSFGAHEYTFTEAGRQVATVSRSWFTLADTYGVDVATGTDPVLILACTVVVDMCVAKHKDHHS
jgi:uncharacterized protein YxjI